MRVFKTNWFGRFARRQGLSDAMLCDAVHRAERELVDADLGSGLIKQRVARPGEGRSGGYRTLLLFRSGVRAVFAYGFAKNERDDIGPAEEADFKVLAKTSLGLGDRQVDEALKSERWTEIRCHEQECVPGL